MKVKDFYDIGVKSGMFGQKAKFGQRSCLIHTSTIGMKNILTKQTVNILMRRLIKSSPFAKECPNLPNVRINPTLP